MGDKYRMRCIGRVVWLPISPTYLESLAPKGDIDTMISHRSGSEAGTYTEWRFTVMPDRTGQPYEFVWSWLEGPVTITEWVDQPLPAPKETEQ